MKSMLVYLCFFLSGISALIYQVVWVREFGNIFGNSIYSASIVIAVFMAGLGVGSYLAGRWADSVYASDPLRPLKAYAWFEIGIALLGLLIALLLPQLEAISASISSYQLNGSGWYELSTGSILLRYLIAVLVLLPSTMLMGGTLTLLIRYLVGRRVELSGWKVGSLYGINTLGAAAGAFLVDFALVPNAGLFATQMAAVLINLLVAIVILAHARTVSGSLETLDNGLAPAPAVSPEVNERLPFMVAMAGLAIFLSGFAAMGMEIIWFRVLSSIFGQYRAIFSVMLAILLLGIWFGSTLGGYLQRRTGRTVGLYVMSQTVFVASAVTGLLLVDVDMVGRLAALFGGEAAGQGELLSADRLKYPLLATGVLVTIGLPAVMMGFAYPLMNAYVQKVESHVGRSSGLLYFANTTGAVLGSLCVGFYLLPSVGSSHSITVLLVIAIAAIIPITVSACAGSAKARRYAWTGVAPAVLTASLFTGFWATQDADRLIYKSFSRHDDVMQRVLASSEGIHETVVVLDNRDRNRGKVLYTNGHSMSSTSFGSQRYMRSFVHVPLLQVEAPSDVLVICFGVGNTLHAATLYQSLDNIEVVDLSKNVLDHAGYFSDTNHDAIEDERVTVYINDGRQHLRMDDDERYDLVTLEPPPIVHAGVSALYSREFYELAHKRLKPGGFLTQWLPYTQTSRELTYSMIRAFMDVFPNTVMLAGSNADIILMGRKSLPNTIEPERILASLEAQPAVRQDMEQVDMATLTELVGSFLGGGGQLGKLVEADVPAVTDDYPIMEYAPMYERQQTPPFEVINVWGVLEWCPSCKVDGRIIDELADLPVYLEVMDRMFETGRFAPGLQLVFDLDLEVSEQAWNRALARTPYLARLLGGGRATQ